MPSSGLSDFTSSLLTNFVRDEASPASAFVISAEPPDVAAGSNDVGLIVIIFILSRDLTVAIALPA